MGASFEAPIFFWNIIQSPFRLRYFQNKYLFPFRRQGSLCLQLEALKTFTLTAKTSKRQSLRSFLEDEVFLRLQLLGFLDVPLRNYATDYPADSTATLIGLTAFLNHFLPKITF